MTAQLELRPYQLEAVAAVERELQTHRSTLLVLATGLGKTVTFAEVARRTAANGGRVLVLAHRTELLTQAQRTLERFGLSTGIEQAEQRIDRLFQPAATIASVQSMQGKRLESFDPEAFALIIIDEAHHVIAEAYRCILDHFASAKVLGVTATPDRSDELGLGNVFASLAYRFEIGEGISGGYLVPLRLRTVRVASLDIRHVRKVAGDFNAGELEAELCKDLTLREISEPLAELSAGRPTLLFTAGVKQAHALAAVLRGLGCTAAALDGTTPADERAAILEEYKSGKTQILCNCAVLTEGFDAPSTSCVALVRPTTSRSLITQCIGRGTRLNEGKSDCVVLNFVPRRMKGFRLASPADVLAGKDLPTDVAAAVESKSELDAGEILELIADAERDINEAKQRVRYAVEDHDLTAAIEPQRAPLASARQHETLKKMGYRVTRLTTRAEAREMFDDLDRRKANNLCTRKQANVLQRHGLDTEMSFDGALAAIDKIAANGWKRLQQENTMPKKTPTDIEPSSTPSDPELLRKQRDAADRAAYRQANRAHAIAEREREREHERAAMQAGRIISRR